MEWISPISAQTHPVLPGNLSCHVLLLFATVRGSQIKTSSSFLTSQLKQHVCWVLRCWKKSGMWQKVTPIQKPVVFIAANPSPMGESPSTSTVRNWKLLAPKDVVVEIECRSDSTTWRKHPSVQSSCHLTPLHDSWWSFLHRIMERLNIQEALMLHTFGHYYVHFGFHWHISLSLSYLLICFHIYTYNP